MNRTALIAAILTVASPSLQALGQSQPPKEKLPYKLLVTGWSGVFIVSQDREIQWHYPQQRSYDAWQLRQGEIALSHRTGIKIVSPEKKTLWEYSPEAKGKIEMHTIQPLGDGLFLGDICGGKEDKRVFEIQRDDKRIVRSFAPATQSDHCHNQYRQVRKTPQNTYLVTFVKESAVKEYSQEGELIRHFDLKKIDPSLKDPRAYLALRLKNGNTLISLGYESKILEIDKDDKVVWFLEGKEIQDHVVMAYAAGMNVLPNGNLIVATYDGGGSRKRNPNVDFDKNPALFEVTRDKKVLWTLSPLGRMHTILHCQILTDKDWAREIIR